MRIVIGCPVPLPCYECNQLIAYLYSKFGGLPFCQMLFFKVDNLLASGDKDSLLIPHLKLNQTNSIGTRGYLCNGLKSYTRFPRTQEVDPMLKEKNYFFFNFSVRSGKSSYSMGFSE